MYHVTENHGRRHLMLQATQGSTYLLSFSLQGKPVEKQLLFDPPIVAYDQDLGINASLTYSILSGE